MDVKIKHFQSLRAVDLSFSGFTVVTGRSNLGKSALFRAVHAAFFGLPGEYYITEGETVTGVVVKDGNDEIVWRKTSKPTPQKPTALRVNGTISSKIGRDHSALTKGLKVVKLETTGVDLYPQFAAQYDQPFLLSETETTAAEVLKMLGRADVITTAQGFASSDRRRDESLFKVRDADNKIAVGELKLFDQYPQLESLLPAIRKVVKEAEDAFGLLLVCGAFIKERKTLEPKQHPSQPKFIGVGEEEKIGFLKRRKLLGKLEFPQGLRFLGEPDPGIEKLKERVEIQNSLTDSLATRFKIISELTEVRREKAAFEERVKVCPTCEKPFESH